MTKDLIQKYGGPVPRYTSYPTAPHMTNSVNEARVATWLSELPTDEPISLYAHIPFCDSLCWFCGCNTKVTNRAEDPRGPVARYISLVEKEVDLVASTIADDIENRPSVNRIHWGGGSPSLLTSDLIARLAAAIDGNFSRTEDCIFSVEIDPRGVADDRMDAFAKAGVNRISVGVQDFDDTVQQAINRVQSFDETRLVIDGMRARGVSGANVDILYGLPHQSLRTIDDTIKKVARLAPDRIALFGYAHVPWMKRHQNLIDETFLPPSPLRAEMAEFAASKLLEIGYEPIGIDHFALPGDPLVRLRDIGGLRRNFQGYTDDPSKSLIGFGVSSIGNYERGLAQNETDLASYRARILAKEIPIARGCEVSQADRLRGAIIERIMCDFRVDLPEIASSLNAKMEDLALDLTRLQPLRDDNLIEISESNQVRVTPKGRPYVRQVAACFDSYLPRGAARHSLAV